MNKKLRDTVLIVATVVTVLCIIIGCYINSSSFHGLFNKDSDVPKISFGGKSQNMEEDFDDEITDIVISMDMASVKIEKGDTNSISIDSNKASTPTISLENGILTVEAKESIKITPFGKNGADVLITVNDNIETLKCQIDMGEVEIRGVDIKDFSGNIDMGDMEIYDSKIESISSKVELGNLELNKVDFLSGSLSCSAGDIELVLPFDSDEYSFDVSVELGGIEIGDNDMGTRFQSTDGVRNLTATVDMGSIEIK